MGQVQCSRCGKTAEGLDRPPLPGAAGVRVAAAACRSCWQEWLRMQVKVINEYRLNPTDPKQYEFLVQEMGKFLELPDGT